MELKSIQLMNPAHVVRTTATGKFVWSSIALSNRLALRESCTNYLQFSDSRRNIVKINGRAYFIAYPLTRGNSKLDSQVLIFDLLAIKTCGKACKACAKHCYAMKAQKQYPDVFNRRALLTELSRTPEGREQLASLICEQLAREMARKNGRRIVRIHSAGDFEAQANIDFWRRIAEQFPEIVFYFYTKQDKRADMDFAAFDALPNVVHCHSIDDKGRLNFGPESEMIKRERELNASGTVRAFLCSYGRDGIPQAKCGKTCRFCMTKATDGKKVIPLFVEH